MAHPTGESKDGALKLDFDRRLMVQFRGCVVTSDAGLLAYRELDDALGLSAVAGETLADARTGKNGHHALVGLLRQSVFGRLAGYEDVNDAERLRHDPAMRWIVGGRAAQGRAASPSQMGRFEIESGVETILWNPADEATPQFTVIPSATSGLTADLFCSGHVILSDGRMLVVGGGGGGPGAATSNQGWRFDPVPRTWTRTGDMTTKRWYPTALMLGDEQGPTGACARVLVAGGSGGTGGMEIYSEATNSFVPVTVNGPVSKHFNQTYPGLHLLPGGEVFYAPTGFANCSTGSPGGYSDGPAAWFTFDAPQGSNSGHWTEVAGGQIDRAKGMSVLLLQPSYPFVRVTVVGGGPASTNATAQTINLSTLSPTWGPTSGIPDGRPRVNVSAVLLPNSTIFVCGGLQAAPYPTWVYDPGALVNAWREMDEMHRPRHYHACALLLPNGKVMMAGGAAAAGCSLSVENSIEVFSPPYLFNSDGTLAARPVIQEVNGEVPTATHAPEFHHGGTFTIETPEASSIAKVVLIRPMAVTHQTDSEQRVLQLTFFQSGSTELKATAPNGIHPHAIAPRGYYMLFVLNASGVPSEGRFVHLH